MVGMDVFAFDVDIERSKQTHYIYQLELGLYYERQFTSINIEAKWEEIKHEAMFWPAPIELIRRVKVYFTMQKKSFIKWGTMNGASQNRRRKEKAMTAK